MEGSTPKKGSKTTVLPGVTRIKRGRSIKANQIGTSATTHTQTFQAELYIDRYFFMEPILDF